MGAVDPETTPLQRILSTALSVLGISNNPTVAQDTGRRKHRTTTEILDRLDGLAHDLSRARIEAREACTAAELARANAERAAAKLDVRVLQLDQQRQELARVRETLIQMEQAHDRKITRGNAAPQGDDEHGEHEGNAQNEDDEDDVLLTMGDDLGATLCGRGEVAAADCAFLITMLLDACDDLEDEHTPASNDVNAGVNEDYHTRLRGLLSELVSNSCDACVGARVCTELVSMRALVQASYKPAVNADAIGLALEHGDIDAAIRIARARKDERIVVADALRHG